MTIIAARRYLADPADPQGGRRASALELTGTPDAPGSRAGASGAFDWIGLCEPDHDEMDRVAHQYGLHPLAVEDALSPQQMPKLDIYQKHLFIVARTATLEPDETLTYGQTAFFLGPDFIISVRFGSERAHVDLRRTLEADPERLAEGADYVLHAILDFIVDGYLPTMESLEAVAHDMEESAIDAFPEQQTIRRIFRLRRQLRRFERVIGPMEEVCERLAETEVPLIDPTARIWFRDVLDHVRRTMARMRGLKETLAAIVETASLLEQHRQGEMTRQLAAWAGLLAVPTAIAGIYGMNFEYMPELRWHYGYFILLGCVGTICTTLYWRFRRIGWL
jgi:magnesium transporter